MPNRVMFIKDGEVFHQIYRGDMTRSALLDKICDAVTDSDERRRGQ